MQVTIKKLPKSEIEVEGELDSDIFETYFNQALKKLGQNLEIDGFRKGKVPESVLVSKIPEISILEEMAQIALNEHYPKILLGEMGGEKIDAVGAPEISITKLARKNPLGFKIKTAVLGVIKLPDYKKVAKSIISKITDAEKKIVVTAKETEDTITDILKSRAKKQHIAEVPNLKDDPLESLPKDRPLDELPEFNDEFVQALGPFKDVEDFKTKLKENIKLEKQNQQKEKTRLKIIEKIIEESALEVSEILIKIELDKMLYRMESDVTQMGLKFDEYLKHLNKTTEDLRVEFRNDAEKKAKLGLILNEIAKVEKILADEEQVAKEVALILEHYKDADPERATLHAQNVLTNEKIFQFLESQ